MISSVFVDGRRMAMAIATTIAGLLALLTIPGAQHPNSVPQRVAVTTAYPGASAAAVDAMIAQPIEAQVVGVANALYMKSVSGNDGSYNLLMSFAPGTDPDINTANVNNRVQVALPRLPSEVRQHGVTVKKGSAALPGLVSLHSSKGKNRAFRVAW
jgi:multidrug efflux pump subunit AcrB